LSLSCKAPATISDADLAKAHVIGMKRLLEEKNIENYEVYNIGTGKGSSAL